MSTDRLTVRVVVGTLALVVVGGVAVMALLATTHTAIPDQLDRLVSLCAGGLIALLAKTSTGDDAQDVQVVNDDTQPVPVDTAPQIPPPPLPKFDL